VLERIKANSTQPPSRIVAKKMRGEAMRCFVKRDCNNYRDDPEVAR